jgi:hypothetical protein
MRAHRGDAALPPQVAELQWRDAAALAALPRAHLLLAADVAYGMDEESAAHAAALHVARSLTTFPLTQAARPRRRRRRRWRRRWSHWPRRTPSSCSRSWCDTLRVRSVCVCVCAAARSHVRSAQLRPLRQETLLWAQLQRRFRVEPLAGASPGADASADADGLGIFRLHPLPADARADDAHVEA